jgi:uncharacterized protein DUF6677
MPPEPNQRPASRASRSPAVPASADADRGRALALCFAAWLIPGAGHLLQHRLSRGLTCLFVLPLMFALGLLLDGSLFPLAPLSQSPLTTAAALAERCIGAPWIATAVAGWGRGDVVSPTYEYGWVLMVVAGLLNTLVVLDAYDIALGRK